MSLGQSFGFFFGTIVAAVTAVFRRSFSSFGARVGSRQIQRSD